MPKKQSRFTTSARCASTNAVGFLLLASTQTAMAGNTVRDHRGPNGAPQGGVTVDRKQVKGGTTAPKLGGPKYKGFKGLTGTDYGKGLPTGPPCATIAD